MRLLGEQRLNRHAAKVSNAWSIELCFPRETQRKAQEPPSSFEAPRNTDKLQVTNLARVPASNSKEKPSDSRPGDHSSLDSRGFPLWRRERPYNSLLDESHHKTLLA